MNNKITHSAIVLLVVVISACSNDNSAATSDDSAKSEYADIVFRGGPVYTMDVNRSWATAVAVRDGIIVYVGQDAAVAQYQGPATKVVNLEGHMLMPSFQDIHIHPIGSGMQAATVDLSDLNNLEEYIAAIAQYAEANPDVGWILGGGWSMSVFGPGALTDKRLIDAVVSDRPVYLTSSDGHSGWANSKALELAGIALTTEDPISGRIDRDPVSREAIGSLQEGAMGLVEAHIPPATLETRTGGLRYAIELLNSYGITAIQDAIVYPVDLEAYRSLDGRGELSLRVVASMWWDRDLGLEQIDTFIQQRDTFTNGRVNAGTVKIMQDGVLENFTAAVLEPYLGQGDVKGIPMVEPEFLKQAVTALDAADFQVHFHAIGDAAIRQCLDAVEAAIAANGDQRLRHHISHLQLIDPADIPRFRELGVIANFQPLWAYADAYITELTIPFLGEERSRWLYPIRSVVNSGAMIAFGSDWSVSSANPLHQIETAVTRTDALADDAPFIPQETIDLPTALAAFTINAAYVNGIEKLTGSVEVGKAADLIVLDRNLFDIPLKELSDTQVLLTLLDGEAVHGDPTRLPQ